MVYRLTLPLLWLPRKLSCPLLSELTMSPSFPPGFPQHLVRAVFCGLGSTAGKPWASSQEPLSSLCPVLCCLHCGHWSARFRSTAGKPRAPTQKPALATACDRNCFQRSHRQCRSHEKKKKIREVSFVPREVREQLFIACNSSDVDASWRLWSGEAEACPVRAYLTAGGPALLSYVSSRTKRLGGRYQDRIQRMNRADEFDVTHSGFFVNSSLGPSASFPA